MAAVTRLCNRAILFDKGHLVKDGTALQVVNEYMGESLKVSSRREWPDLEDAPGNEIVRLREVRVCDESGQTAETTDIRNPDRDRIHLRRVATRAIIVAQIDLYTEGGRTCFPRMTLIRNGVTSPARRQACEHGVDSGQFLSEGNLLVQASLVSHTPATILHAQESNVVTFQVIDNQHKDSARGDYVGDIPGLIRPKLVFLWTTTYNQLKFALVIRILNRSHVFF
jgi:lipopolysaccharide transport system ATP-binding protein